MFTNKEKNKKIIKSVFINYLWVGSILAVSILMLWEYKTRGYVSVKYHRFYGEEAKEIAWLTLFSSLALFIYCTLLMLKKLLKKSSREKYFKEISEFKELICADCRKVNKQKISSDIVCPHCSSRNIEELSGFFRRHPEKVSIDNTKITEFRENNGQESSKMFLGLAIFMALLVPTFIAYIVYILIINPS